MAITATPAIARQEAQPWQTLTVAAPLGAGFRISGEAIDRVPGPTHAGQFRTRLLVGHPVTPKLVLWIGYGHLVTYRSDRPNGIENQVVEQASWTPGSIGQVRFSSRTRLEQRFQRGDDRTSWRLHEQIRADRSLGAHLPGLVLWTEPFFNVHRSQTASTTLDQWRTFAGLSVPVTPHANVEFGYMNQYIHRRTGDTDVDVIPITLALRF